MENLADMDIFLEAAGIDSKTKENHFERLLRIAFARTIENLNKVTGVNDMQAPEMNSLDEFFDYYTQYVDRDTINKIIQEETQKVFNGYFNAIGGKLLKKT